MTDIYSGPGLKGVPRGTVKRLRLYEPHYGYPGMGGHINIGIDGPWDVHRILGTVPVEADGSAAFRVPANTPIAVQPLDAEGKALQLMRSWYTAMPGETFSCVGCHDTQNTDAAIQVDHGRPPQAVGDHALVRSRTRLQLQTRGAARAGQVLRRLPQGGCRGSRSDAGTVPDFTAKKQNGWRSFTPSYIALHPFVRRPGPESDYHLQRPLEFHADTSELVQMLRRGHYNVQLDAEAWDRLVTWIDLNVPDHGTWTEHAGQRPVMQRRQEMHAKYAQRCDNPEEIIAAGPAGACAVCRPRPAAGAEAAGPSRGRLAVRRRGGARRQAAAGLPPRVTIALAEGKSLELALIPAGEFIMGDAAGDGRRVARQPCERRPAVLHGRDGNHQRTVRRLRCPARQRRDQHAEQGPEHPRPPGERAESARGSRHVAPGHGVLPVAVGEDGPDVHPADRGPMGVGLPRRDGHAVFLRRFGHRLRAVRQPGRRGADRAWPAAIRLRGTPRTPGSTTAPW